MKKIEHITEPAPHVTINSTFIPEIVDYKINDTIEMNIVCKVTSISSSYDDNKKVSCGLDIKKAEITNPTEDRKEARRKGLDIKDYMDLKSKEKK